MRNLRQVRQIYVFCEDFAQRTFLTSLLERMANEHRVAIEVHVASAIHGHGKALMELRRFVRALPRAETGAPDLLLVAIDGNCKGFVRARQDVVAAVGPYLWPVIYAIPDPHIERWLLLDSAAFKSVVGRGCAAPDQKCDKDRYKRLLLDAVRAAQITPSLGGIEYAPDIVHAMDLRRLERVDDSLGRLLQALRDMFQDWELR